MKLSTQDYLFMQFKKLIVPLDEICAVYYPHLQKKVVLEKASKQEFPFTCFKLDDSRKAPYFANISDIAQALDNEYIKQSKDHQALHS